MSFYTMDLDREVNVPDLLRWIESDSLVGVVDEDGGIVAYVHRDRGAATATLLGATDTVRIRYEIHADDLHHRGEVDLPSWCSGDPRMAVALYSLGHSTSVSFVTRAEVVNQPLPTPSY